METVNLTLEQIKAITVGALRVWEENGDFHFAKCTQKQVDAWYKLDKILGSRSETTTGIRLDFYTDSKLFAFTPQVNGGLGRYEIYVDNVFSYYYTAADFEENARKAISLDGKEHRITLYLPAHVIGALAAVELEKDATIRRPKFDRKMLFIGDSITHGWDSTWDSLSYAQNVSRFFNAESVIQGIGGAYYHNTVFDKAIDFEPDIVVVAYGTNDWRHYASLEEGRKHCSQFLDQLVERYGDKKLFGISPLWRKDSKNDTAMGSFESCRAYIKAEIKNHNMILIDGDALTPHLSEFYCDEVLHPNTSGFAIYALNLIREMEKSL